MIFTRGFLPQNMLSLIEAERIQLLVLLPLMFKALLASPELDRHDYSSLCRCVYGMAPMDSPILKALKKTFNCPFVAASGKTEIAGVSTVLDPHWGEAVTAFVSLKPGFEICEENVINHCREKLGRFEVRKKVVFLKHLPMTATGKIKKHLLRKDYEKLYEKKVTSDK